MKLTHKVLTVAALLGALSPLMANAQTANVPKYVNFQSVLRDDAGNLVEDGFIDMQFRILDQDQDVVYEETQPGVQVVRSAISIMIGEGIVPGSSPNQPTGGVPASDLDPSKGSHFLQVQFGSSQPSDAMELGSVPYAMFAQLAIGIVPDITESEVPPVFVTEGELASYSASIVETINNSSSSITINESHIDQTITRDDEADAKYVDVAGDQMTGDLNMNNHNITNINLVDGVNLNTLSTTVSGHTTQISSLNSTVADHETRLGTLESNQVPRTCSISAYSAVISDDDSENCRIHAFAIDFGLNGIAMSGLASITNINDNGVFEKKDQSNVVAIRDDSPNKMLFIIATSRDTLPAIGGLAIGTVPATQICPFSELGTVGLTEIINHGILTDGDCTVKNADINLAKSAL